MNTSDDNSIPPSPELQAALGLGPEQAPLKPEERVQSVNFMLQVFLEAQKLRAVRIKFDPPDEIRLKSKISFFTLDQNSKTTQLGKTTEANAKDIENLAQCLADRCFVWPDNGDVLFESNQQKSKRIFLRRFLRFDCLLIMPQCGKPGRIFTL